jgi:hypothetical protein
MVRASRSEYVLVDLLRRGKSTRKNLKFRMEMPQSIGILGDFDTLPRDLDCTSGGPRSAKVNPTSVEFIPR